MEESINTPILGIKSSSDKLFKISIIILGFLIVLGLFLNVYLLLKKEKPAKITSLIPTATPDLYTEQSRSATANWITYNNPNFPLTFKYPQNITLDVGGGLSLQLIGSKQPKGNVSAFVDGIDLGIFIPSEYKTASLKEYVQQQVDEDKKLGAEIVQSISEINIGNLSGYTYTLSLEVTYKKIFLQSPLKTTKFVRVNVNVADPTGQGYQKIVDLILSTFKFLP